MKASSHHQIAIASIKCFTDDGILDMNELNFLLGLAMRDGIMDNDEKRVLGNIFGQVSQAEVGNLVWERIQAIKSTHGID